MDEDEMMGIVEKVLKISNEYHRGICLIALTSSNEHNFKTNIHAWLFGRDNRSADILGKVHFDSMMDILGKYSEEFGECLFGMCNQGIHGEPLRILSIRLSQKMRGRAPIPKSLGSYERRFRKEILGLPIFYVGDNVSFNGYKNTKRPDFICLDNRSSWFIIEVFATYHKIRKGSNYKSISDYLRKRRDEFDMSVLAFDETIFLDVNDSVMKSFIQFLIAVHFDGVHLKDSFVK